jgi:hypothetical protein
MNTSESINEIATALAKAQGEIRNPHKSKDNPHFRSKYADIADGLEIARPVLSKHGLAIIQATELLDDGFVVMRTRLIHTSGQFVEGLYPVGRLTKHTELGAGMTYAKRQSLFALIGIAGDTDDMDGADTGKSDVPASSGLRNQLIASVKATEPQRKSSYAMKKDEPQLWPTFEKAVRATTTLAELDAVWEKYSDSSWPKSWQEQASELFTNQLEIIAGPAADAAE